MLTFLHLTHKPTLLCLAFASFLVALSGCGKKKTIKVKEPVEELSYFAVDPVSVPGTNKNQLASEPTEFLRSRSTDSINWQPWSPELLETAESEQKPIFAVVTGGQYPSSSLFLDEFSDPSNGQSALFNQHYICSLIDIEAQPEMAVLASILSLEIRKPLSFPFLLWLSHEGNPVAWLPIKTSDNERFEEIVTQSNTLVMGTWKDSQTYFIENSQADNERRQERALITSEDIIQDEELTQLVIDTTSFLSSLYDPATRSIDRSGGLLPTGLLRYLAHVSALPELPNYLRERCLSIMESIPELLASSPITDPLDDGIFTSRRSRDWSIPRFTKNLNTQSEMAISYALSYEMTGDSKFSSHSENTLKFAQKEFGKESGGYGYFKNLRDESLEQELYFWTLSDIQSLLLAEEFEVLKFVSSLSKTGNIPVATDASRKYFRKNILSNYRTIDEFSQEFSTPKEEASNNLKAAKEKISTKKQENAAELNAYIVESTKITEPNAIHALALFRCGQLLQRSDYLVEGRALLTFLKQEHYDQLKGLWRIPPENGRRGIKARGRDYACLIAALLEAYRIELNAADLVWAEALARESLLVLANDNGHIQESPKAERFDSFALYNKFMTLGDSTWGSILESFERLSRLTIKTTFAEASDTIKHQLQSSVIASPMTHTDYLSSLLVPITDCVAVIHGDLSDSTTQELHQLLLAPKYQGLVLVRPEIADKSNFIKFASIPNSPGVSLYRSEKKLGTAISTKELKTLLSTALEPR